MKDRDGIERRVRRARGRGVDGLLVVMLTYGPAMRVARALDGTRLPVCLANIQPVAAVTPEWDMGDLTYNQGIHGAQDTANAMVRAGRRVRGGHRRLARRSVPRGDRRTGRARRRR